MGATILVDDLYYAGKALLEKLDENGVNIPTAFLAKSYDDDYSWSIVIAMDGVKENGSRASYELLLSIIKKENIDLALSDTKVVDKNDVLITSLRKMLSTGKGIEKIKFFGHYINGQRFPDAIIYRSS